MSVAPGTPTFTPPAYSVPTLAVGSVAIGATVTTVTVDGTGPFRFGQVFKAGDLAPSAFLVGKIAGQPDVTLQFNVLATHPDGSVRHALISGVAATTGAVTMALARSSTGASTSPTARPAVSVVVALNIGGTAYTVDAAPAMAGATTRAPGAISTESNVTVAAGPDIEVLLDVVYFAGSGAYRVNVTFEHTKNGGATGDVTYSGTISVGGAVVYTLPNPLTHFPRSRWMRSFWYGNASPATVRQDRDYLIDSQAVANYDRRVTISEATLAGYPAMSNVAPMSNGVFLANMSGVGGRPDIGLLPAYHATAVLSMDARAIALAHACAAVAGSWSVHVRDTGTGLPLSCVSWPYATTIASAADVNPATGQSELITIPASSSTLTAEESHTPNFAYLSYLLTGDRYYMEEMQFWTAGLVAFQNYSYRQKEKGIIQINQTRGQAWLMRGLVESAAFTPDAHPLKSHFKYWVDSNAANYDALYTNNVGANVLGVLDSDADRAYSYSGTRDGIGLYQDDFFTSAIGHGVELGFANLKPLLAWKAKFQVGRMLASNGWCYINSCFIGLRVRDDQATATYTTLAQCQAGTIGVVEDGLGTYTQAIHNAACNSQTRLDLMNAGRPQPSNAFVLGEIIGYANQTDGYVANLQPGLAMAVDSGYTDGDLAWDLFDGRTVKPNYSTGPQFAIVPRALPLPEGKTMKYADLVNENVGATLTDAGTVALTGAVSGFRTLGAAIDSGEFVIGDTSTFIIGDSVGNKELSLFQITGRESLTRLLVKRSTNGNAAVVFPTGAKTIYNAPASDWLAKVVTTDNGVTVNALTAATLADGLFLFLTDSSGNAFSSTVGALKSYLGVAAAAETLSVASPGAQTAGVAFAVTGTYGNVTPAALDWSVNGGSSWTAAASPTISGGTYSFGGVTVPSANASQTIMVRDHTNTSVTATSASFVVNATATESITVATPASPQTVGTPFTVTGTWTVTRPTALDYQLSDGGGAWIAATSPTISGGTYSFSITPASASASRTITVRDHNNTSAVSAASGSYVVNAAPSSTYTVRQTNATGGVNGTNFLTTGTINGGSATTDGYAGFTPAVYILDASGNAPANGTSILFAWGASPTVPPTLTADVPPRVAVGQMHNAAAELNTTAVGAPQGGWAAKGDGYYGLYSTGANFFVYTEKPGNAINAYLWTQVGSTWIVFTDTTGTPIPYVLT